MKILEDNKTIEVTFIDYYSPKVGRRYWTSRSIRGEERTFFRSNAIVAFVCKQINAMTPHQEIIPGWNVNVDDELMHEMYRDATLFEEVRVELRAIWCEDLLVRPQFVDDWTFTFEFGLGDKKETEQIVVTREVYYEALADINRHKKRGPLDNTFKVADVRRPATLNDVMARAAVNSRIHYMGNPSLPIELNVDFKGIYKDSFWNATIEEAVEDYLIAKEF